MSKPTGKRNQRRVSTQTVFSSSRTIRAPKITLPASLKMDKPLKMDGLKMLSKIPGGTIPAAFFDPQYRGVYEHMQYGNEKTSRNYKRVLIPQMTDEVISKFVTQLAEVIIPSGHLFLWVDKFHLCTNYREWFSDTPLDVVDMMTWSKEKIGLGYRTRHMTEFLVVLQKQPKRAKDVWRLHDIPDLWKEKAAVQPTYHHPKPIRLQARLIEAVTNKGDVVVDPAAGTFSVMDACWQTGRHFLGCDVGA